jgi:hypothetical protein
MVQSVDIYTSLAHLTGAFELPTRVTLKLFLGGLRGLGELFATLKAGNNDHFCDMFELLNRVILKLFLGGLGKLFTTLKAGNNSHFCDMFKLPNRVILKLFFNFVKVVSKLYLRLLDFT